MSGSPTWLFYAGGVSLGWNEAAGWTKHWAGARFSSLPMSMAIKARDLIAAGWQEGRRLGPA